MSLSFILVIVFNGLCGLISRTTTLDTNADLNSILSHISQLEAEVQNNKKELDATKTDLAAMKVELQTTMTDLHSSQAKLEDTTNKLQTTTSDLQETQQALEGTKTELEATKKTIGSKRRDVAFQVYIYNNELTGSIYNYSPVKYDGVSYNPGNVYNTTTGKFTAPVSGTYMFHAQADIFRIAENRNITNMRIAQSSRQDAISQGESETIYDFLDLMTTIGAITYVKQGEQVWVYFTSQVEVYGVNNQVSTFSGALLSAH